ncbi:ribbon-helix-helix protein, CopG family [Solwaraspora sp. WMMB335]|uniref:ribbon-helix-helix protein, CopG family n=1 Tax=Solwaraspora sp. WMMB335 TaxID=3404118 RepID=UPI003B936236
MSPGVNRAAAVGEGAGISLANNSPTGSPAVPGPPPSSAASGGAGGLVRVTVNLTPRSADALDKLSAETGQSKTDVINRALQVYQVVEELLDRGGGSILVRHPNGEQERIYII